MITGLLLIGLGFALGYRKIQKRVQLSKASQGCPPWLKQWEERSALRLRLLNRNMDSIKTINRNMDCILEKITALQRKIYDRDQNGQNALECGYSPKQIAILSFGSPVPALPRQGRCWKFIPGKEHCSGMLSFPPLSQTLLPSPDQTASERFVPPRCRAGLWPAPQMAPDRMAACQSWICFPLLKVVSMVYVLLCWGVFFLFSHCTPQWSIVWGLIFFFPPSPHVNAVLFFHSLSSCSVYPVVICMLCMYGQVDG